MRSTPGCQQEFRKLASLLAHELRNPLAVILGNASFLLGRTPAVESIEPLTEIRREGQRALGIINAFLELGVATPPEPASLMAACQNVRSDLMRWSPHRQIDIRFSDELPAAAVPQVHLELVLQNLVSNADKYSPPEAPINIRASEENGLLLVSVMDNGPGIPLAEQQSIFSRRYRLGQHKNLPGSGLGLPTCKELVAGWSGQIWYEPEIDSSSKFCFTVPIWKENTAADERPGEKELLKLARLA
jgi:two-component system, OmpR family, sensor histidine kinase KdpD